MSSTYGEIIKFSIFGESHGAAIGMTLDGVPAGLRVDFDKLQEFLNRRAPDRTTGPPPGRRRTGPNFSRASGTDLLPAPPSVPSSATPTPAPGITKT